MTSPEGQPVPALAATALFGCVVVVAVLVFVVIVRVEVMVTVRWAWLTSTVVVRDRDDDEPTAIPIAPPTTAANRDRPDEEPTRTRLSARFLIVWHVRSGWHAGYDARGHAADGYDAEYACPFRTSWMSAKWPLTGFDSVTVVGT